MKWYAGVVDYLDRLSSVANPDMPDSHPGFLHFSMLMILWGAVVLLPGQTLAAPEAFELMTSLADPMIWGILAVVIGVSKIHFLVNRKNISASIISMIAGYFWALVGISFMFTSFPNTGGVVYLMLSIHEFWGYKILEN